MTLLDVRHYLSSRRVKAPLNQEGLHRLLVSSKAVSNFSRGFVETKKFLFRVQRCDEHSRKYVEWDYL